MGRLDSGAEVAALVRAAITEADHPPECQALLLALMARPGRILAQPGSSPWPGFVLETCAAFDGDLQLGLAIAAAVEFAVAAIDVVDDLIDDEWETALSTRERALNAALMLGWLAPACLSRLGTCLSPVRLQQLMFLLATGSAACCAGQDLDLRLEQEPNVSEAQSYEMTQRKSGRLVAMACQVGAALAVEDPTILRIVADFGLHVGLVAQVLNDLAGVTAPGAACCSDLQRHKKTLPIVYTLCCAHEEGRSEILDWYERGDATAAARFASAVQDLGGLHYGWLLADIHRREALTAVRMLTELTGAFRPWHLRRLVPTIHGQLA